MRQSLRQFVRERASYRCEYCHFPESASAASFHVEHVIARQHRGSDHPKNRCWSCYLCNLKKGPNLSAVDPLTGIIVRLYNPRRQRWARHFTLMGALIIGLTRTGRATVALLDMNELERVRVRQMLIDDGEWLPD